MPTRRYFANNCATQTLNGSITSGATSCTVSGSFAGWPTQFPFFAELDYGTASAEIVSVTNIVGTTATIVRAQGGTAAISHAAGATFDHVAVAQDFDEANAHTSANSGVHGVSGSVVGTSDAQTLTNKTLASPVLTGTATGASATFSGTVQQATSTTTGNDTAGSYTANGNGAVTGVIVPKTYTNEAAATTALGTPVTGTVVYLSAPTTAGTGAGLFEYNGTAWKAVAFQDTMTRSYTNEAAATAALGTPVKGQIVWLTAPTGTGTDSSPGAFIYDGSNWRILFQDTGWLNITVNATFAALSGNAPQCRIKNGWVYIRGAVSNTGLTINTVSTSVMTLPAGVPSPTSSAQFFPSASSAGNATAHWVWNTGGTFDIRVGGTLGAYYQTNFCYPAD